MVDVGTPTNKGAKWVCPNDRQLALRAKLKTGWSVKTQDLQQYGKKPQALNETEQNVIKQVIQRAELLDQKEQERVGRLVDRLDNMKRNVMGNGTTQCILCGDTFGMFGAANFICQDCKKLVCEKCGVEIISSAQEPIWLCKICSETREMWKKSGAWFFKGLPKYKLPEKKTDKYGTRKISRPGLEKNNWSKSSLDLPGSSSRNELSKIEIEEETSSEDDKKKFNRMSKSIEEPSKSPQVNLNVNQVEKSPRSPGAMSSISGSLFFNTSSDSGMGESERNLGADNKPVSPRERYQREVSAESSESNNSTFSRQTSSTFSESQQNLTSSTTYLSSVNQSYEKLSLNYERNKIDSSPVNYDRSPTFNRTPFTKKSPILFDKSSPFSKSPSDEKNPQHAERIGPSHEKPGRKLPVPKKSSISSVNSDYYERMPSVDSESQKYRKKVSIDFGKAAAFLKYPLKNDKKKEKNKLNKFSSSETYLDSSAVESGSEDVGYGNSRLGYSDYYGESMRQGRQTDNQLDLGANHWMSQESGMDAIDSLTDLNLQSKWRRESMSSISRDYYWSEDQVSISSSIGMNHDDVIEAVGSQNAQLGVLELSLWYDPVRTALHCTLHRGKGLRATDINGLADPFCKLNILPTTGKSNRMRTKTVHKTTNPEFNETVNFYGITETDIQRKTLHILVLDDDKYGNDFLGEAKIPLFKVGAKQTKHVRVFLEKHYQVEEEEEIWGEDGWNRGQILLTLCYSTKKRALIVVIGRCANLLPMDNNGLSDPFVKLHLRPDPNHKKYKTSVKWKNLNPVFNEEFIFETKMTDLPKQTLVLSVWDKDYGKSNDYLGGLELGWKSKGERLKHWIDVIKFPDHKHEGWHRLGEDIIPD